MRHREVIDMEMNWHSILYVLIVARCIFFSFFCFVLAAVFSIDPETPRMIPHLSLSSFPFMIFVYSLYTIGLIETKHVLVMIRVLILKTFSQ